MSKWNKIEHRMFSCITIIWRGRPLRTFETVVSLTSNTRTNNGLTIACGLDEKMYGKGKKVSKQDIANLKLTRDEFHGEWNYAIMPKKSKGYTVSQQPLTASAH